MQLDIWMESHDYAIGHLTRSDDLSLEFDYTSAYLEDESAVPISLGLPLLEGTLADKQCRAFFQNLLPENDQVEGLITREGLERNDIAGVLFHLGADCSGAVSCLPSGSGPYKKPGSFALDYDVLREGEINEIVRCLAHKEPLPDRLKDPSPVAGVQRKIALARFPDGRYALPKVGSYAPTTHILKVPQISEQRDVYLECAAAKLAQICGIDTAVPTPEEFGDFKGLLIERFDRSVDAFGNVRRIHQEDFAQALGLAPILKYERHGNNRQKFDVMSIKRILDQCVIPASALQTFMHATFFNLAIGNNDNHAKNYALIYDVGPAPRISKMYDMLPIKLNKNYTHELAYNIGGATHAIDIKVENYAAFFKVLGLSGAAATRYVNNHVSKLLETIDAHSREIFAEQNLKQFDDLFGEEAQRIIDVLGIDLTLRERDLYVQQAGGWASS